MEATGSYFDGRTSRKHAVSVSISGGVLQMRGEFHRNCPLAEIEVSEKSVHAARKFTFADGAYIEMDDAASANALLAAAGHTDSLVERLQQNWGHTLMALFATLGILVLAYLYLIPATAYVVARSLPESAERSLGNGVLAFLDSKVLSPTTLSPQRQREIVDAFSQLKVPQEDVPRYRILFRAGPVGPNAFALPSGDIILTDDMVKLVDSDEELMGVLGHELGHLHERHMTQRLLQSSAIAAASTLLFGDVSAVLANVPTAMLDMKYSRAVESDADDYSVALLKANGISPEQLARVFEKMTKEGEDPMPYLSSHPMPAERVLRIRGTSRN